jgi:undecaprenyl-diphosphatase
VSLRVRANALDLALYRRVRSVARTRGTVRSYSRLGEHGAVWLATGAAGITFDWGHRRRLLPSPLLYAGAAAMGSRGSTSACTTRPTSQRGPRSAR